MDVESSLAVNSFCFYDHTVEFVVEKAEKEKHVSL
jgi:hypothetical protein